MAEDWLKLRKEITAEFKDNGAEAYIISSSAGAYDITTGANVITETDYLVYALVGDLEKTDNDTVLYSDMEVKFTVPKNFSPSEKKNLLFKINGLTFKVKSIRPVMPAGVILFYKIQCEG